MTDSSGRPSPTGERASSRLTVGLILVVVLVAGIGAFAAWRNSVSASNDEVAQNQSPAATVSVPSPSANAVPSVDELRERLAGLQSTQRQILDEIDSLKQKIAAEQGERKLLAAQLGSLSVRLDEFSAAAASITERSSGQPKSRPKSR